MIAKILKKMTLRISVMKRRKMMNLMKREKVLSVEKHMVHLRKAEMHWSEVRDSRNPKVSNKQ